MKPCSFLAFDLGASSGRAILGTLAEGKLDLREVHRFPNGHKRIGEALFWDYPALVAELKTGLRKAAAVTTGIAAIGIDTWGVDYVLFDRRTRQMKSLPYHYRDERTAVGVAAVAKVISRDELYRRTGIQFMPLNTIYQLEAHRIQHPEDFAGATFLFMPDALALALGGDFRTEYTDASTGNLLNPAARDWDFELIEKLGFPRDIFPAIVPPCSFGGTLEASLAAECGLGRVPLVKVGSHDTASAVGAVPAAPGTDAAYISCGTWALLGCELPSPALNLAFQTFTNEGGLNGKIRYLANIMGCWLLQECRRDFQKRGLDADFGTLSRMARAAEPFRWLIDPNAADFVAPDGMVDRIRAYCRKTGQNGAETMSDGAVLRAVYDSLALCFRNKFDELERATGKHFPVLNIIGGGTQDTFLMQSAADAVGRPVAAGPVEATAIGNILAQAVTVGALPDWDEARQVVRRSFPVVDFAPDAERSGAFAAQFARFMALPR